MSIYITANVNFTYEAQEAFNEAVHKLIESGYAERDENGKIFFTDEVNRRQTEETVVFDSMKRIEIPILYLRNGDSLIEKLSDNAIVNGRIISTDGRKSFTEINDSEIENIDADDLFEENNIEEYSFSYDSSEFNEDDYEEHEDKIFNFMDAWVRYEEEWL